MIPFENAIKYLEKEIKHHEDCIHSINMEARRYAQLINNHKSSVEQLNLEKETLERMGKQ